MQKISIVFRLTILIVIPIFLNSCASSTYQERYGNTPSSKKSSTNNKSTSQTKVEDEITQPPSSVSSDESQSILDKLNKVIETNKKKEKFLIEIVGYLNTPYRYGGKSRNGIDCSAFTQNVYKNSLNVNIPRTAREQYRTWTIFKSKADLKFGDLIYFNTSRRYFPGHVGIYLDDNLFAHASSSKGVIVSSLENDYYSSKFVGANRITIKQHK
jgi:cell wall-associated NlpC family hydrolase